MLFNICFQQLHFSLQGSKDAGDIAMLEMIHDSPG